MNVEVDSRNAVYEYESYHIMDRTYVCQRIKCTR